MKLPEHVASAMALLEAAGYPTYAVGGCVRDWLLGLEPHDYDLCTAASPEEMQQLFAAFPLVLAGVKHGTVGVITGSDVVEITTFRTEGSYGDCRHPDWVAFVTDIREDLSRRDFTINAMAYSPTRGLCDPFGGQEDLKNGVLRAVGEPDRRFREDALRILRGLRFAARFRLKIEPDTFRTMCELKEFIGSIARERVFTELSKLLLCVSAHQLVTFGPILAAVIPELAPMLGFDQHSPHHAYDVFTHTAFVVESVPADAALRWAALLHDVGKVPCFTTDATGRGHFYGHAQKGAEMANAILHTLKSPTALREQVVFLIDHHMTKLIPDRKFLKRCIGRWSMDTVRQVLALQRADMGSKGTGESEDDSVFDAVEALLQQIAEENQCLQLKDLNVTGTDMIALGMQGKQIGSVLNYLLDCVIDETLSNEKAALIAAAKTFMENQNGI